MPVKDPKRVAAAKKAWETMRANKLAEKRSNAAKKAAETRRRNKFAKADKKPVLAGARFFIEIDGVMTELKPV